jgi:hypothetical protein
VQLAMRNGRIQIKACMLSTSRIQNEESTWSFTTKPVSRLLARNRGAFLFFSHTVGVHTVGNSKLYAAAGSMEGVWG